MHKLPWALLLALAALPVRAETSAVSPGGFTVTFREEVQATPEAAWKAIVQLPAWWDSRHTWSGRADHMSLDLQAGGCWCERWGDGASVQHGRVTMVMPGRALRLQAKLGPLHELPVDGVLTLVTSAQDGKTFLRLSYRVGGPSETALDKLAPAVDEVLGQQFRRLKAMAETGKLSGP